MNNIFFSYGSLTPLSWALIFEACLFAMQLALCFKVRSWVVKCVPILIVIGGLLFGLLTSVGVFGTYSAGAISGNGLAGFFIACIVGIASIGVVLAWAVYGLARLIGRRSAV